MKLHERLNKLHDSIAADVLREVGRAWVQCSKCGLRLEVGMGEASSYLAKGWPMCCGETMHFHTQKDHRSGEAKGRDA